MPNKGKVKSLVGLVLLGLVSPSAFAYIDPGSGSAIVSAIIGFFVAIGMAVKTYWYKIKSFFGAGRSRDGQATDNAEAGQPQANAVVDDTQEGEKRG